MLIIIHVANRIHTTNSVDFGNPGMKDLLSTLAISLRAADRSRREYGSLLDVAAGKNAMSRGQLSLAIQYFERAIPVFVQLADEGSDGASSLTDLMAANACLIDTLERCIEGTSGAETTLFADLATARRLQSQVADKLAADAWAIKPQRLAERR